jgi:hypothetical protein
MLTRPLRRLADAARQALGDLGMLARLTRDLPAFLRTPMSLGESNAWHRERLRERPRWLVRCVERQIYAHPGSPYLRLLRAAGCEAGDLRALVDLEGVEGALQQLVRRGVYVTYDEMKGQREAVRGSQRFHFAPHEFDNPLISAHYSVYTGGTGGRQSRVSRSLGYVVESGYAVQSRLDAHDVLEIPQSYWYAGPIDHLLRNAKFDVPIDRWFFPLAPLPLTIRVGAVYLTMLGRLAGRRFPLPAFVDLQDPAPIVAHLRDRVERDGRACLLTNVSAAVRIAAAATAANLSLAGVSFIVISEPYTEARRATIEASGARASVNYGSQEVSIIASSCATPLAADDLHVFDSRYAVGQHTRQLGPDGPEIDALLVTSLTDDSPKTLLNVETGDSAALEVRDCDCALGALGLRTHLSHIRSFEKLTGEGMTFARTNLMHVVEAVLPARFGGTSVDYQVVEEEWPGGLPRLVLRVSPSVGPIDDGALRTAFLGALARDGDLERYMAAFWSRANTIEVERQVPHVTPAGKVLPFQLVRDQPLAR